VTAALVSLVAAYLIGAIPFSFLVARAFGVEDVRRVGSGNVGATNVLRSAGRGAGALALGLDAAKGAFAVALAERLAPDHPWLAAAAAASAVVGHSFPVFLGFRGGKGVATGLGAFVVLEPLAAVIAVLVFGLAVAATRYASLGSLLGALALALLTLVFRGLDAVAVSALATAALVALRHHANLRRLLAGSEPRLGAGRGEPGA